MSQEPAVIDVGDGVHQDNSLDRAALLALESAVQTAIAQARPILFRPACVGRFFSAGMNLPDLMQRPDEEVRRTFGTLLSLTRCIFRAPVPVATAASGHAVGLGAILVLVADYAAMSPSGKLRFPEATLGLPLFTDIASILRYRSDARTAERMLLEAEPFGAEEALARGLIAASDPEPLDRAHAWLNRPATLECNAVATLKDQCRSGVCVASPDKQVDEFMRHWGSEVAQQRMSDLCNR